MLRKELIHSCSYPVIADAALRSLGCDLRNRVAETASLSGKAPGAYAAALVSEFAELATARQWRSVQAVMSGDDTPLLTGFRYIVEFMLDSDDGVSDIGKLLKTCTARMSHSQACEPA